MNERKKRKSYNLNSSNNRTEKYVFIRNCVCVFLFVYVF